MSNGSFEDYYKQLIGFKIAAYREEEDEYGGDPWPIFTLTRKGYKNVDMVLQCDPEGNGAGFADLYYPDPD